MMSLRARLSAAVALVVIAGAGAQWYFISRNLESIVKQQMLSRLEHDAETIASALETVPDLAVPQEKIGVEYRRAFSGHYFAVRGAQTEFDSRSLWDFEPDFSACDSGQAKGPRKQTLLVYCMPLKKGGREVTIWVAEETTLNDQTHDLQERFTFASAAALAAILAAQALAVYAGLAPLRRAVRQLKGSETPAVAADLPLEIRPFAREIGRLLDAIRQRLEISRQTAGNLAHEQKTHLASIQASVDALMEGADPKALSSLEEISKSVQQLKAVAERHLARAALAGDTEAGVPFDWTTDLQDLRRTLLRIYTDRNLSIEIENAASASPRIERQDALELLGILLDNACRFARSRVRVTIARQSVTVEDDGSGLDEEQMKLLAVRGARIDENTQSGLGLSIARDIAHSYGFQMEFAASSLGGLRVRLSSV